MSEEALKIAGKKKRERERERELKGKGEKEKYTSECRVPEKSKER